MNQYRLTDFVNHKSFFVDSSKHMIARFPIGGRKKGWSHDCGCCCVKKGYNINWPFIMVQEELDFFQRD